MYFKLTPTGEDAASCKITLFRDIFITFDYFIQHKVSENVGVTEKKVIYMTFCMWSTENLHIYSFGTLFYPTIENNTRIRTRNKISENGNNLSRGENNIKTICTREE